MATEMEFVPYKDFVESLAEASDFAATDKGVVSNSTNGPRSMPQTAADKIFAQRTLAGNIAPAFIPSDKPNPTTTVAGQLYMYNGSLYVAKVDGYQGPWDASKFTVTSLAELLKYPYLEYEDVKDLAVNGVCSFLYYGKFVRGLLSSNTGEINPEYPFRIASETWFNFGRELIVTIAEGFKAGWLYDNAGTIIFSGFKSGSMTIPGDKTFRVAIQRDPENQNEIADIKEFGSAVTFLTPNEETLVESKKNLQKKTVYRQASAGVQPCEAITTFVDKKLYIRAKFVLPDDFHNPSATTSVDAISIVGKGAPDSFRFRLYKQSPTRVSANPRIPCPEYHSGLYATLGGYSDYYSRIIPDGFNNIVSLGKDLMSIRFAGDVSQTANQDLRLKIDATTISIYHSTDSSVVKSYTKSSYSTAKDFYEAVLDDIANGPLSDYEVEWWNLEGYTLDDLIQCEVDLVAQYQNVKDGAYTEWRAFPFYFTTKDKSEHTIEIVLDADASVKAQMIVDGFGVEYPAISEELAAKTFNNEVTITFGAKYLDTGCVDFVSYTVSNKIDYRFPMLRVYYAERVKKGLEGSSYYLSENKFTKLIRMIKDNGFGDLPMSSVLDYLRGHTLDNRKYFHFTHDDTTHDSTSIMDARERETYLRCDVTPSFGMQMEGAFTSSEIAVMKALRQCEWMYHIHTMQSTDPSEPSKSLGLYDYDKMVSLVQDTIDKFVETFGEFPLVWDFHEVSEGYNQVRYLMNRGFQLIFGGNGNGLLSPINRYHCGRRQVAETTDLSITITPYLDNFLFRKRP